MKRSALALAVVLALAQLASAPPVAVAPAPVANVSGLKPEEYGKWTRVWEFESIASMRSFTNATHHFVARGGVLNATLQDGWGHFEAFWPVGLRRIAIAMRLAYTPPKSAPCYTDPLFICGYPVLYIRVGLNETELFEVALYIRPSLMGVRWIGTNKVYVYSEFIPPQNEWIVFILDLPNGYWRVVNGSSGVDIAHHDVTPVSDSNYYHIIAYKYEFIHLYEIDWIAVDEVGKPVTLYPSGFNPYDPYWLPPSGSWKYVIDFSTPGSIGFPQYPGRGTAVTGFNGRSEVRGGRFIALAGGTSSGLVHTMLYTYLRRIAVAVRANVTKVTNYCYIFGVTTKSSEDQAAVYTLPKQPSMLDLYNGYEDIYIPNPNDWFVFVVDNVTQKAYVYDRNKRVLATMPVYLVTDPDSPLIYMETDAWNDSQDVYNVEIDWIAIWDEHDRNWRFVLLNASAPTNVPPGSAVPVTVTVYLDGWWDPNEVGEVRLYDMSGALIASRRFKAGDYNDTVITLAFNVTLPGEVGIYPYTVEIYNVNKQQVDDRLTLNIAAAWQPLPPSPPPSLPTPGMEPLLALLLMWWWLLFLLLLLLLLLLIRRRKEEEGEEIVFIP